MFIARSVLLFAPLLISTVVFGLSMNSSVLFNELHKLNTVGSVLFVAAPYEKSWYAYTGLFLGSSTKAIRELFDTLLISYS